MARGLEIRCLHELPPHSALAPAWNRLAGDVPFRRWEWISAWWRHYGRPGQLFTLAVYDSTGRLVGAAPWFRENSWTLGRVVRFLGTGEVCSDYLDLLAEPESAPEVVAALAQWLATSHRPQCTIGPGHIDLTWDHLELTDTTEHGLGAQLAQQLGAVGCPVHQRLGPNCWRLTFPQTWAEYEACLSKSHRKQVRRLAERWLRSGRAVLHTVRTPAELERGFEILCQLHQARRQSLGQPGCFASKQFADFHRQVCSDFLAAGRLRLHWLEIDQVPVAAEYHLAGEQTVYGYQAGVDPNRLEQEPGRLAAIATLELAQADGYRSFDFLRGDEPYKAHWRATPTASCQWRIAAPRPWSRARHRLWLLAEKLRAWLRAEQSCRTTEDLPVADVSADHREQGSSPQPAMPKSPESLPKVPTTVGSPAATLSTEFSALTEISSGIDAHSSL